MKHAAITVTSFDGPGNSVLSSRAICAGCRLRGAYTVRYKLTYEGVSEFSLIKDGKQVLRRTPGSQVDGQPRDINGGFLHFINPYDQSDHTWEVANVPVAKDINGDGIADLVFLDINSDAHHSASCTMIALADKGPRIEFNQEVCESRPEFKDLNHDARLEIVYEDVYEWHCCVPERPRPKVVIAWNGTAWAPSAKLMAAQKPSEPEMDKMVRQLKKDQQAYLKYENAGPVSKHVEACIDSELWGKMLDLIYSGNGPAAHELLQLLHSTAVDIVINNCFRL